MRVSNNPLPYFQLKSNWRPVLLYIVHNENDDILRINLALMRAVSSQYICYMLQTDLKDWNLYDWRNNQLHLIKNYSFADAWSIDKPLGKNRWDALEQIYKICRPSIVHFHHLIANHPDMIEYFKDRGHPVVMSFHDFYTICPTIQLMDNTGKYCAGYCNTLQGDCQCTPRWFTGMPHLKDRYVHAWHDKVGPSLSLCDAFIVPSPSTRDIIRDHYPYLEKSKFRIIEHGHNHGKTFSLSSEAPSICSPIKVVLFGQLDEYRGLRFIEGMLQHNQNSGNPVELHILGTASLKLDHKQSGLICYGSYTREELPEKLAQIRPTLALLPSFWPETFGYDLFEVWTAGIPVLGSSLGATGDLLRRHGGGWTLYPDDPQQWFEKILEIANSPEDYQDRIKEVRSLHLRNTEEMAQDYVRVYQRLLVPVSNKPETDMEPIQTMIN